MYYYENHFVNKVFFLWSLLFIGSYTSYQKPDPESEILFRIQNPDQWSGKIWNPKSGKNVDPVHPY